MKEDVTFAQLRTFACAAQTGSFAQAAEKLNISQAAVSEQIKILEERLGRVLFRRRKGTTPVLTSDGESVLQSVDTILAAAQELFDPHRRIAESVRVRISAGPYVMERYLRPLIPQIYHEYPEVEIDLLPSVSPEDASRLIESGELELAIYAAPADADDPPFAQVMRDLPMVAVAAPGTKERLKSGKCSLEDFQFIFPMRKDFGARWAKKCLRELCVAPRTPPLFTEFVDVIVQMVEDGHAIGYIAHLPVADKIASGRLDVLDISLAPLRRMISRSPHAPPPVEAIENILRVELSGSPNS